MSNLEIEFDFSDSFEPVKAAPNKTKIKDTGQNKPKKVSLSLSETDKDVILRSVQLGDSAYQTAKKVRRSLKVVLDYLRQNGLYRKPHELTEEEQTTVKLLYRTNLAVVEIAARVKHSEHCVLKYLKEQGLYDARRKNYRYLLPPPDAEATKSNDNLQHKTNKTKQILTYLDQNLSIEEIASRMQVCPKYVEHVINKR